LEEKTAKNFIFAPKNTPSIMINAIIVDDHELFCYGVKAAIANHHPDICIVAAAKTGEEFFRLLETTPAHIVLLDVMLPDMSGVEIARRLKKEKPEMKILAISAFHTQRVTQMILEVGINGFISKETGGIEMLAEAIRSVMSGLDYFGKDIYDIIYRILSAKKDISEIIKSFTTLEKKIIDLCSQGMKSRQIAEMLQLSPRTIENYKNIIFKKIGINSTAELIHFSIKNGIIEVAD